MRSRWWDIRILCKWSGSRWIMLQPTSLAQSLAGFIAWCLGTLKQDSGCKTSSGPSLPWPWRPANWWRIREGRHSHANRFFSKATSTLPNITVPPWCKWNRRKHCLMGWVPCSSQHMNLRLVIDLFGAECKMLKKEGQSLCSPCATCNQQRSHGDSMATPPAVCIRQPLWGQILVQRLRLQLNEWVEVIPKGSQLSYWCFMYCVLPSFCWEQTQSESEDILSGSLTGRNLSEKMNQNICKDCIFVACGRRRLAELERNGTQHVLG